MSDTAAQKGAGIMLSYRELLSINNSIAEIKAKLDATLVLRSDVDTLFNRVRHIELTLAAAQGGGKVMTAVLYGGVSLVSAIIGSGVSWLLGSVFTH